MEDFALSLEYGELKKGSYAVLSTILWVTKFLPEVLGGDVGLRCWELLREIIQSKGMVAYAGSINPDHAHILVGIPQNIPVSKAL